jgi:hypothetical protein
MITTRASKVFIFLFITTIATAGSMNFKKGDSWEYDYQKNSNSFPHFSHSIDTINGKIILTLDSITKKLDTVVWYFSRHDFMRIKSLFTSYYTSSVGISKDTAYATDSIYQQTFAFVKDVSIPLTSSSTPLIFFYYFQRPDSFANSTVPDFRRSSKYSRKTILEDILTNTLQLKMFTQTISFSSSENDMIFINNDNIACWIDGIGMYQIISNANSADQIDNSFNNSHEQYTLIKYNEITLKAFKKR